MTDPATPPASRWREWALMAVVACGAVQTVLVYADAGGAPSPDPLTPAAARGLELWRQHNCQSCHQLYGFGGFLGPDLTNVRARYTAAELSAVLEFGRNRMPAFGFQRAEQADLMAFLEAMDASGRGQPRGLQPRRPQPPDAHFGALFAAHAPRAATTPDDAVRHGFALIARWNCGACHVPLASGRLQSPDLSRVMRRTPEARVRTTLNDGRNAMPGHSLEGADADAVVAALRWMLAERDGLIASDAELLDREPFAWSTVPWWEYPR